MVVGCVLGLAMEEVCRRWCSKGWTSETVVAFGMPPPPLLEAPLRLRQVEVSKPVARNSASTGVAGDVEPNATPARLANCSSIAVVDAAIDAGSPPPLPPPPAG